MFSAVNSSLHGLIRSLALSRPPRLHDWLWFELLSAFAIETASFRGVSTGGRAISPSRASKSSPSSEPFVIVVYSSRAVVHWIPNFIRCPGFKFDCATAVSDRLAILGTSSLQGKRILKVEFSKSRK
ncbi:hypothetical protein Scep_022252 [Stephania cephalantha]|uniref:Uncharacterized protein n=1 Tax=Stephania cephalantha TaxID=152367 RepID=A0AAP0FA35_9MAGN